jgi:ATP-dependent DNA ligase
MPKYINYRYIFPPRPKNAISPDDLNFWDNGTLICQPKLNGSNCLIFTNGQKIMVMNRHNQRLTNFQLSDAEVKNLYRGNGGWMILNGEYLNKSKSDETGQAFNHKFVIFDILCYDGDYLVGKTFEERVSLLDTLYDCIESEKDYLYSISTNVYRVKSYRDGFKEFFDKYTPIDIIEGVVMKRCNAKLEVGSSELNNSKSQIKCRKSTKNYKY